MMIFRTWTGHDWCYYIHSQTLLMLAELLHMCRGWLAIDWSRLSLAWTPGATWPFHWSLILKQNGAAMFSCWWLKARRSKSNVKKIFPMFSWFQGVLWFQVLHLRIHSKLMFVNGIRNEFSFFFFLSSSFFFFFCMWISNLPNVRYEENTFGPSCVLGAPVKN